MWADQAWLVVGVPNRLCAHVETRKGTGVSFFPMQMQQQAAHSNYIFVLMLFIFYYHVLFIMFPCYPLTLPAWRLAKQVYPAVAGESRTFELFGELKILRICAELRTNVWLGQTSMQVCGCKWISADSLKLVSFELQWIELSNLVF